MAILEKLCRSGRLKIYFLREEPSLQYCIHNAGDPNKAVLYFKRVNGFIKWQDEIDAHKFWNEERRRHGIEMSSQEKTVIVSARELREVLGALPEGAHVSLTVQGRRLKVKSGESDVDLLPLLPTEFTSEDTIFGGASGFDVAEDPFNTVLKRQLTHYFLGFHENVVELCFKGAAITASATPTADVPASSASTLAALGVKGARRQPGCRTWPTP